MSSADYVSNASGVPAIAGVPTVNNPFSTGVSTLSVIPAADLSLLWLESLLLLPSLLFLLVFPTFLRPCYC